jgi:hypothetical protein
VVSVPAGLPEGLKVVSRSPGAAFATELNPPATNTIATRVEERMKKPPGRKSRNPAQSRSAKSFGRRCADADWLSWRQQMKRVSRNIAKYREMSPQRHYVIAFGAAKPVIPWIR